MYHKIISASFAIAALLIATTASFAQPSNPISVSELSATVRKLASADFQGRAPGTPGEATTVDYLIARLKALGMEPGGQEGSWTQTVPLIHTQVSAAPTLIINTESGPLRLIQFKSIYVFTLHAVDRVTIDKAPLVFVGYGVTAPERQWDDFKGADLKGKIAVFLANDPDFEALSDEPVAGRFAGKAMTNYGRPAYKYEEAARRGAVGVLIVHEPPAVGYDWPTVVAGHGGAYDIDRPADSLQPALVQGWLQRDEAVALFKRAGLDFEAFKVKARRADFHPVALGGETLSSDFTVTHTAIESHNVLAKLRGTTYPDQTIIYGAHWDAYGIGEPDAHGDPIRHGANDDGLGVAGVLEIARAFKAAAPPKRTVVFAFWTAEERGLLGSETYGLHPIYRLDKTVASFTLDILQTAGLSHDVVLIGSRQNSLEEDLRAAAAAQDRFVTPQSHPEYGTYYRTDQLSLAKRGVPTLALVGMAGPPDLLQGGREAGNKWVDDYSACYHKVCDNWSPTWDLRGAAQDVELFYDVGRKLANSDEWPQWYDESEFKSVRTASDGMRQP